MSNPAYTQEFRDEAVRQVIERKYLAREVAEHPGVPLNTLYIWIRKARLAQAWVEEVLGLKMQGDHLRVDPVIPGWWNGFSMRYRHGEAIYEIQVDNPEGCERGVSRVEMDGQHVPDGVIPLHRDLVKHRILVSMGNRPKAKDRLSSWGSLVREGHHI